MVRAMQEQQEIIDQQQTEIKSLRAQQAAIKTILAEQL